MNFGSNISLLNLYSTVQNMHFALAAQSISSTRVRRNDAQSMLL